MIFLIIIFKYNVQNTLRKFLKFLPIMLVAIMLQFALQDDSTF